MLMLQGGPKKWGHRLMTIILSNFNRLKILLEDLCTSPYTLLKYMRCVLSSETVHGAGPVTRITIDSTSIFCKPLPDNVELNVGKKSCRVNVQLFGLSNSGGPFQSQSHFRHKHSTRQHRHICCFSVFFVVFGTYFVTICGSYRNDFVDLAADNDIQHVDCAE